MEKQQRLVRISLKGISVLEIVAVLIIVGVLLSYLVPGWIERVNRAKYEKMLLEMKSIAQAGIDYYNAQDQKPLGVMDLKLLFTTKGPQKYLSNPLVVSPWGKAYVLDFENNLVIVSTSIPAGITFSNTDEGVMQSVRGDQISIAQTVPGPSIGRLEYEKKFGQYFSK